MFLRVFCHFLRWPLDSLQISDTSADPNGSVDHRRAADLTMCSMPEISSPTARSVRLPTSGERRLNLVIPVLSQELSFAGIITAQRFFKALATHFAYCRIIVTHEGFTPSALKDWPTWYVGNRDTEPRTVTFLERRDEPELSVAEHDIFIATSWSSAMLIESLLLQQTHFFGAPPRRYVYFIQEYEPLLYPASPQYCLAEASYRNRDSIIAVFNTKALASYFLRRGITFNTSFIHEPLLHPSLANLLGLCNLPKERLIFIYSRPAFMRNGFRLLIEGLKYWARTYPGASQWSVVSAGGKHPDLWLPHGVTIRALNKLTLEAYGALLSRAWIGLSLSFSAHPGQVAQEAAAFGCWSITNPCETRDPAAISPRMVPIGDLSPQGIAAALSSCCSNFQDGRCSVVDSGVGIFRTSGAEFEFLEALLNQWM